MAQGASIRQQDASADSTSHLSALWLGTSPNLSEPPSISSAWSQALGRRTWTQEQGTTPPRCSVTPRWTHPAPRPRPQPPLTEPGPASGRSCGMAAPSSPAPHTHTCAHPPTPTLHTPTPPHTSAHPYLHTHTLTANSHGLSPSHAITHCHTPTGLPDSPSHTRHTHTSQVGGPPTHAHKVFLPECATFAENPPPHGTTWALAQQAQGHRGS